MDSVEVWIRAQQLKVRREVRRGLPYCDMCGERPATERHHIITKQITMGNERAAAIANGPLITAPLCNQCHQYIDTVENRNALLQKMYVINGRGNAQRGYEIMKGIYDAVAAEMATGILWEMPLPE